MHDIQRSRSPLLKSLSSKDLRNKAQTRPVLSKQISNEHQGLGVDANLLHELDSLLSKKLHLGESGETHHEGNGVERATFNELPEEKNSTEPSSDDAIGDDEEDDDHEFANVDEIDGPISPSSSSGSLNEYFQLNETHSNSNSPKQIKKQFTSSEDNESLISYEDIGAGEDSNLPIDDALKKLLDEKANEINGGPSTHPFTKPKLDWNYGDSYNLYDELADWFIQKDFNSLKTAKVCFEKKYNTQKFVAEHQYATEVISELGRKLEINSMDINGLLSIAYVCFGAFGETSSYYHHQDILRRNNTLLMAIPKVLLACFRKHAECCRTKNSNLSQFNALLFYSSSILFFIISVGIEQREKNPLIVNNLISEIEEDRLLVFLTQYIDHWRWRSRLSMRIRNIIVLLHRVILLQFGDKSHYNKVKRAIKVKHDIKENDENSTNLSISPLEYMAFREDITSRYPSCEIPKGNNPELLDNPNSLSQFLEIPRPRSRSTSNQSLGEPQIHIATPAPSPPNSPPASRGIKNRKSFQANLAYPNFFPTSGDFDNGIVDDLSERLKISTDETLIPCNMKEAIEILSNSVQINLSTKQLWHERELFMIQERGWNGNALHDKDPFIYNDDPTLEGKTMQRVERYYEESLPQFSSLVYVLLETIETNLSNQVYFEDECSESELDELKTHLELTRSKEIAMKSCAASLHLLLKWFKLSHVLKFEYLCSLIYDSKFIPISIAVLGTFTDHYQDKLFKRCLTSPDSFWNECAQFNTQYKDTVTESTISEISNSLNTRILSSEISLLNILSKITGRKTQRLKDLPLNVSNIFNSLYQVFSLDIYHPILKIIYELAPFKNKRWRAEHMELISGVFLYEKLPLTDNWITGKDISGEINDAYGQEIALRAMLQFYNFYHYKSTMEQCGYDNKVSNSFFSREAELLSTQF